MDSASGFGDDGAQDFLGFDQMRASELRDLSTRDHEVGGITSAGVSAVYDEDDVPFTPKAHRTWGPPGAPSRVPRGESSLLFEGGYQSEGSVGTWEDAQQDQGQGTDGWVNDAGPSFWQESPLLGYEVSTEVDDLSQGTEGVPTPTFQSEPDMEDKDILVLGPDGRWENPTSPHPHKRCRLD